jgi:hypothetical protein
MSLTAIAAATATTGEDFSGMPWAQEAVERAEQVVIPARTVIGWVLTGVGALDQTDPKMPFVNTNFEAVEPEAYKGRKITKRFSTSNATQKSKKGNAFVFWNITFGNLLSLVGGIKFITPPEARAILLAGLGGLGTPANPLSDHTSQVVKPILENFKKLIGDGTFYTRMKVRKLDDGGEISEFGAIAYPANETKKELGMPQWAVPGGQPDDTHFESEDLAAEITSEADLHVTA